MIQKKQIYHLFISLHKEIKNVKRIKSSFVYFSPKHMPSATLKVVSLQFHLHKISVIEKK